MTKVIAEGITNWPAENTQLIGSACADCGAVVFPVLALAFGWLARRVWRRGGVDGALRDLGDHTAEV